METLLHTLIVPGDGSLTSSVANAGELVSPARISPPSPLDLLRIRGLSLLVGPDRGPSLSELGVESRGKASVAGIVAIDRLHNAQSERIESGHQSLPIEKTIEAIYIKEGSY
jgi:hypothetical protein